MAVLSKAATIRLNGFVGLGISDFIDQRLQFNLRTDNHRAHGIDTFQRAIDIDTVENLKAGFRHRRTQTRRTAFHLLVQNAAAYLTQENDITDRWNIHTGGQQIDGHDNIGQPLFVKAGDHSLHFTRVFISIAGNLDNRVMFQLRILFLKCGSQLFHHHIGMRIGDAEHQRFL